MKREPLSFHELQLFQIFSGFANKNQTTEQVQPGTLSMFEERQGSVLPERAIKRQAYHGYPFHFERLVRRPTGDASRPNDVRV